MFNWESPNKFPDNISKDISINRLIECHLTFFFFQKWHPPAALISTKMIDVMKKPELASYLFITWALDIRCSASEKSVKDHNE